MLEKVLSRGHNLDQEGHAPPPGFVSGFSAHHPTLGQSLPTIAGQGPIPTIARQRHLGQGARPALRPEFQGGSGHRLIDRLPWLGGFRPEASGASGALAALQQPVVSGALATRVT